MRWLLLKDLQILRRSPFLVAVLVAYPVIISVLIGLALSRGPDKPKVAIVNELPAGQTELLGRQPAPGRHALRQGAVQVRRSGRGRHARGGHRQGALGRGPRRAHRPARRHAASCRTRSTSPARRRPRWRSSTTPTTRSGRSWPSRRSRRAWPTPTRRSATSSPSWRRATWASCSRAGEFSLLGQKFDVLGLERSKAALERTLRTLPPDSEQARDVQAGHRLRADRHREPRPVRQGAGRGGPAAGGQANRDRGPSHAAGRLRGVGVGDHLAHVRHRAAGLGHARARARGARLRAARARARLAPGAAG